MSVVEKISLALQIQNYVIILSIGLVVSYREWKSKKKVTKDTYVVREFSTYASGKKEDYDEFKLTRAIADWILEEKLCVKEVHPVTRRKRLVIKVKVKKDEKVD